MKGSGSSDFGKFDREKKEKKKKDAFLYR